jgi:deoxyribodipyrimidine photo-lyase
MVSKNFWCASLEAYIKLMSAVTFESKSAIRQSKRFVIHWFRHGDLRLQDNPALIFSSDLARDGKCPVIPVFCFDKKIFGVTNRIPLSKCLKCGVRRAKFIIECVKDLREQLESRLKSKLLISFDQPSRFFDRLLLDLKQHINSPTSADGSVSEGDKFDLDVRIVCQDEVVRDEREAVIDVTQTLRKHCLDKRRVVEQVWGSTLFMPNKISINENSRSMPNTFAGFSHVLRRDKIDEWQPMPGRVIFPEGFNSKASSYLPSLTDLGYTQEQIALTETEDPRSAESAALLVGGETAGLERVHDYIWDSDLLRDWADMRNLQVLQNKSSKFSPWLAHGCVSPRFIASEAKKYHAIRRANKGMSNLFVTTVSAVTRLACLTFVVVAGMTIPQAM